MSERNPHNTQITNDNPTESTSWITPLGEMNIPRKTVGL